MPYKLAASPLQAIWRTVTNIGIDYPGTARAMDPLTLSDYLAAQIVGRAMRRFDLCNPLKQPKQADTYPPYVYEHSTDLKGFCFVAADEFELFYTGAHVDAKCVRVVPDTGGGDHYFTVVRKTNKKNALIVDATWRQFYVSGNQSRFCQVGPLDELKNARAGTITSIDLGDAYKAGLKVLDSWDTYHCFP